MFKTTNIYMDIITKIAFDRDKSRNLEFGLWIMDFGLLLWIDDDSGLPTGPLTTTNTKTLNTLL